MIDRTAVTLLFLPIPFFMIPLYHPPVCCHMEYDGNKEQYTAHDMNHCPVMPYFVAVPMSGYVQTNS